MSLNCQQDVFITVLQNWRSGERYGLEMYVHELLENDDHSSYQETISTWKGGEPNLQQRFRNILELGLQRKVNVLYVCRIYWYQS